MLTNLIRIFIFIAFIIIIGLVMTGSNSAESTKSIAPDDSFGDYWYQGKAELNRYNLKQVRYSELRQGDAVLIFVTEDFVPSKQVKYEYKQSDETPVSVLKVNFTRRFLTGIYPYSMMSSVFTPVSSDFRKTLKVTTTVQEWCGHTFMQLNYRDNKYNSQLRSYFQLENDQDINLGDIILEDELWTRIRIDPQLLPSGEVTIFPGTQFLRLSHLPNQAQPAKISISSAGMNELIAIPHRVLHLSYHKIDRELKIYFSSNFPYEILGWEESSRDGKSKTSAVRTNSMLLDYWNKNGSEDTVYREKLGLE